TDALAPDEQLHVPPSLQAFCHREPNEDGVSWLSLACPQAGAPDESPQVLLSPRFSLRHNCRCLHREAVRAQLARHGITMLTEAASTELLPKASFLLP